MAIIKTLMIHRREASRNSTHCFNSLRKQCFSSIVQSNFDSKRPVKPDDGDDCKDNKRKEKKPLHVMFGEAVGVMDSGETSEGESEEERRMIRNLKKLEKEVNRFKEVKAEERIDLLKDKTSNEKIKKPESLSGLFSCKKVKIQVSDSDEKKMVKSGELSGLFTYENVRRVRRLNRDMGMDAAVEPVVLKKLSTEMLVFIEELYKGGYFYHANFLPGSTFDASYFEDSYSREYVKYAADSFAKDHQDIAKWLSGSQVKTVALYGCPTLIKKAIFAAKRLRAFFKIQEDTVCSKCALRESCKFVNQNVWNGDTKNLNLDDTMRVIIFYGLEAVDPKLPLPDHIKATINLILRDIVNLSKSTSRF